jgi:glutamine cyclotransferase
MQLLKEIPYNGEGWGLCNDGKSIIMSDGTERITFRNPTTFAIERTIEVYDNEGPIDSLNELEYINGKIYANIYTTNKIIIIEPLNGKILSIIDGSEIEAAGRGIGEVMNGIAENNGKIYMTGKNWEKLFEVKIDKIDQ